MENETYACNKLRFQNRNIVFIEPNPVAFYYSLAKGAELDMPRFKKTFEVLFEDKNMLHDSLQN
ncbi:MAG TPA: hypothetical protein VK890_06160, partial [Bacteroidia bacterium]|nr:hypothetical protein [Bacteroidia bacterium]